MAYPDYKEQFDLELYCSGYPSEYLTLKVFRKFFHFRQRLETKSILLYGNAIEIHL